MNAHPSFRRRFLVNTRHQLCHACGLVLLACVNGALLALLLAWLFLFRVDGRMLSPMSSHALWYMAGGLFLTSLVTVAWSLWYTKSLVGLLHKVVLVLGPLGQGAAAPQCICIRKEDKGFEAVETVLNSVARRFQQLEAASRSTQEELSRLEQELAVVAVTDPETPPRPSTPTQEQQQQLARASQRIKHLQAVHAAAAQAVPAS